MIRWLSRRSPSPPRLPRSRRRWGRSLLLPSFVIGMGVIFLRQLGGLEAVELGMYDRFMRWRPDEGIDERMLVVGVDEADIQTLEEYPLTDGTVADLLEALESYNPRVIALDIGRDIPQGQAAGRERLQQVVAESDRIITACKLSSESQPGSTAAPGTPDERVGFADFPQDPGGIVRRSILVSVPPPPPEGWPAMHLCNDPSRDQELLSLSFLAALMYLDAEGIQAEPTPYGEIQLDSTILFPVTGQYGGYRNTGALDYQLMLNYRSATQAVRQVTLMEVMEGEVDPSWIRDRVVMIGYTSSIVGDILLTPYLAGQADIRGMPGVVVHAQSTSQILSAVLNQRPLMGALYPIFEWVWILLWAFAGGLLATFDKRPLSFFLLGGVGLLVCCGLPYLLFLQGVWMPLVPGAIALIAATICVWVFDQADQGGYTQAIFEQLQEQVHHMMARDTDRQRQRDYLEDLVRRARSIRQKRSGKPSPEATEATPPGTPDDSRAPVLTDLQESQKQRLYEQLKAQMEPDGSHALATDVTSPADPKAQRLQSLLERARTARRHPNHPEKHDG